MKESKDRPTYERYLNLEYTNCSKCNKSKGGICTEYSCDKYKEACRFVVTDNPHLGYKSLDDFNYYFGTNYKEEDISR